MADIFGTDAADTLRAAPEGDFLWGLGGDDTLIGSSGNDVLVGGPGFDTAEYPLGRGVISIFSTPVPGVFLVNSPPNGFIDVGTDILVGVEQVREEFSNFTQTVDLTKLSAPMAPSFGPFWDSVARVAEFNHAQTGQWYVVEGPDPQTIHNWDALAAKVQANFEATGQWFL